MTRSFQLILSGLFALLASCASQSVDTYPEDLRFKVAIIPLAAEDVVDDGGPSAATEKVDSDALQIELDPRLLSEEIEAQLDGPCFYSAELLEWPKEGFEPALSYWVKQAKAKNADLILSFDTLRYDHAPSAEVNTLTNLPLFLIGGPWIWWIDDRTYQVEARLIARLFDANPETEELTRGIARGLNREYEIGSFEIVPDEVSLDFSDRAADNKLKWYALSFVWPTGYLATTEELVGQTVASEAMLSLARNLASNIRDRSAMIVRPDEKFVYVDISTATAGVSRTSNGSLVFSAVVLERDIPDVTSVDEIQVVTTGGEVIQASWPKSDTIAATEASVRPELRVQRAYPVRATLPESLAGGSARLIVVGTGALGERYQRSWTFPIPE